MSVLTWRVLDKHSYRTQHFSPTPKSDTGGGAKGRGVLKQSYTGMKMLKWTGAPPQVDLLSDAPSEEVTNCSEDILSFFNKCI